jgi:hypothetical protein
MRILHQLLELRLVEGFDACRERGVAEDEDGRAVFARDPRGFDGDVEAVFDGLRREDDARAVAVAAEDRLVQIALLDVGREAGARDRRVAR